MPAPRSPGAAQGEASHIKTVRRNALIAAGAIPHLAHLVTYAPRMPEPPVVSYCCGPWLLRIVPHRAPAAQSLPSWCLSCVGVPQVPAFPPAGGKKPGAGGKSGGKGKKGGDARPPAGRKDAIATHAAACLRFLALCANFRQELLGRCAPFACTAAATRPSASR